MTRRDQRQPSGTVTGVLTTIGVLIGLVVGLATSDVILGVIAGASFIAVSVGLLRVWTGGGTPRPRHP